MSGFFKHGEHEMRTVYVYRMRYYYNTECFGHHQKSEIVRMHGPNPNPNLAR